MPPSLDELAIERHNALYDKAWSMVEGELLIDGIPESGSLGFFLKRRLNKAIKIFEEVIEINSMNWNAMFGIAKIYQRFGETETSYNWMLKAREFAPDHPSLAKETAVTASNLGMHDKAIEIMREAISARPDDAALHSNLGLSLLLSDNPIEAIEHFHLAQQLEPSHTVTPRLIVYARAVQQGDLPTPKKEQDIVRNLSK
ncbi:MAG: tetratricopeptide repeat protein [Akkermansiaceae bacterium]